MMRVEDKTPEVSDLSEILIIFILLISLALPIFGVLYVATHSSFLRIFLGLSFTLFTAYSLHRVNRGETKELFYILLVTSGVLLAVAFVYAPEVRRFEVDRELLPLQAEGLRMQEQREEGR
jgi:hypothetical protein